MALQDDYIRTALRVPRPLHKALHEAAAASTRTFNAEIVSRLEASFNLEPMKEAKRAELLKLVNEAIDERLEIEKARVLQESPEPLPSPQPKRRMRLNK